MANEIEIMHVLRIPPLGKLIVQVGETQHKQITEISDGKTRQKLLAAIGELIAFAGGYQTLVDAGFAPPIGLPVPSQLPQKMQQEAFLQKLEQERDKLRSSADPNKPQISHAAPIINEAPAKTDEVDRSLPIVTQIDAILQQFVAADTELTGRSIHLTEHPDGGLRIEVDGKTFNHPNKLGEPKIQKMIKRALREWENL